MQLPKTLDPIKFAKQHIQLNGELPLSLCSRLEEICHQDNHQAEVDLQFDQDAARLYFIKGAIKVTLNLICQRCNSVMQHPINHEFLLSPVVSDERAKNLPSTYEPVFMQDELISVYEMIEDEILLALPMVPKHEQCEHDTV